MVKIIAGNNVDRKEYTVNGSSIFAPDPMGRLVEHDMGHDATLKDVCDIAGIDTTRYSMSLNGVPVTAADLEKTPEEKGLADTKKHFLLSLAKTDNA